MWTRVEFVSRLKLNQDVMKFCTSTVGAQRVNPNDPLCFSSATSRFVFLLDGHNGILMMSQLFNSRWRHHLITRFSCLSFAIPYQTFICHDHDKVPEPKGPVCLGFRGI